MKSNTKSSITLPPAELKMVDGLMKKLGAKTKVEVIRRGLYLLQEKTDREALRRAYADASRTVLSAAEPDYSDLDSLAGEGLEHE